MKEKDFTVDELTLLLKASCREVLRINDFIRSSDDVDNIRDSIEVDSVRILRKICLLIEDHVNLHF